MLAELRETLIQLLQVVGLHFRKIENILSAVLSPYTGQRNPDVHR